MEYLLIFLKNKISLYGSRAYIASVLSLAGSRFQYILAIKKACAKAGLETECG